MGIAKIWTRTKIFSQNQNNAKQVSARLEFCSSITSNTISPPMCLELFDNLDEKSSSAFHKDHNKYFGKLLALKDPV